MKSSTKNLVTCALFAALMCAVAPVSIPLPGGVPVTLQTAVCMIAGLILGAKYGALSQLIYLLLGAFGLPIFAGFSGGMSSFVSPSGGFLVGFIPLAWICGFVYGRFGHRAGGAGKYAAMIAAMLLGNVILYAIGLAWFMAITGNSLAQAMVLCMIPFIPGDLCKMVVALVLVPQLEKALHAAGVEVFA